MGVNKVDFANGETVIDLRHDTVTPQTLAKGDTAHNSKGEPIVGEFPISEVDTQAVLIEQIARVLDGKAGGSSGGELPDGYRRCDYIQFTGNQFVDTGIIGNQDIQICTLFTWDNSTQRQLFGCASSDNTKSITAYMNGTWRFGNKSATKSMSNKDSKMPYSVRMDKTTISIVSSVTSISGTSDFETVGTVLLGGARDADGTLPSVGIYGKVFYFYMWQGDEQVLKLVPVTDGTTFRFWDVIGEKFYDSVTDKELGGGNL